MWALVAGVFVASQAPLRGPDTVVFPAVPFQAPPPPPAPAAPAAAPDRRTEIARLIERRLETAQPLDLEADTITLEGDVLHLKGSVRIVLGTDSFVRADQAKFDRAAMRVQLIGNAWASLGFASGVTLPRPKIEYR